MKKGQGKGNHWRYINWSAPPYRRLLQQSDKNARVKTAMAKDPRVSTVSQAEVFGLSV